MKACLIFIFFCVFFILLNSCGKKSDGSRRGQIQYQMEPEGIFSAKVFSVNQKVALKLDGIVTVTKYGDNLNVRVKFRNGPKGLHMQGLYTGDACPYEDLNGDGFIDIKEAEKNIQKMLIPFDGDISGQALGSDFYPVDNYAYERSTSYSLMLSDLQKKDQNLQLEGKVIVIHGVSESQDLPESVLTYEGHSRHKTIPIACGILGQVTIDPRDNEPETTPIRVRPRPRPDEGPIEPAPEPEVERPRSRWERLRDRIRGWWRRGRSEDEGGKP